MNTNSMYKNLKPAEWIKLLSDEGSDNDPILIGIIPSTARDLYHSYERENVDMNKINISYCGLKKDGKIGWMNGSAVDMLIDRQVFHGKVIKPNPMGLPWTYDEKRSMIVNNENQIVARTKTKYGKFITALTDSYYNEHLANH